MDLLPSLLADWQEGSLEVVLTWPKTFISLSPRRRAALPEREEAERQGDIGRSRRSERKLAQLWSFQTKQGYDANSLL